MRSIRLGRSLLLIALAAALMYTLALLLVFSVTTITSFKELEVSYALADLQRADKYIGSREAALASTTRDYSTWDDARRFLLGSLPPFLDEYFPPESLENLELSFAAFYRMDGELAGKRAVEEGQLSSVPPRLEPSDPLRSEGGFKGRLRLDGKHYLIASLPVTSSDGRSPPSGYLVLGQTIDSRFFDAMATDLGLSLIGGSPDDKGLQFDAGLLSQTDRYVKPDRKAHLVRGFLLLRDSQASPFMVVRTEAARRITDEAHHVGVIITVASPILLLLVIGVGWLAIRLLLLAPLERLESILDGESPGDISKEVDEDLSLVAERKDAIGRMASMLIETRKRLRDNSSAIVVVNEKLESEVDARTAELRRADRNLKLYRKIMEGTSEGVVITDLSGTILEANDAFCRISGYERGDFLGKNPRVLKSDRHEPAFYAAMWQSIIDKGQWSGEVWDRKKNGEVYPKWLSINTILDDEGKPEAYVGLSADISRVKEAEERLSRMVFYDSLTGLPNRALFRDRLAQSILRAQRSLSRCALLFLDLDRFKNVNDSLGHLAGDDLLVMVAKRILAEVREVDTVCRLGGDEFTVILDEVSKSDAAGEVANKIIRSIRMPFMLGESEVYVGASIGISLFPFDGTDEDTLIKKADAAMYEAKEAGRGQFRFAAGTAGEDSRRHIEVEGDLRRALENGMFELYYQPQVAAGAARPGSSAGLVGAEALIRLRRADGSVVSPGSFIDVAEDSGLILQIGEWALGEACREAVRWTESGMRLVVSVNVSPRQFERGDFVETVRLALEASGLEPALLKLEVTESLFMRKLEKSIEIMREIRKMGVTFAVDDFGIGFSSLQYLNRLPLDYLKIDKAFVDKIEDEFEGGEIVTAVIALARAFGLASVAEGVENEIQLKALKRRGCDEFQGYLISRPLDAAAFSRFALGEGEDITDP